MMFWKKWKIQWSRWSKSLPILPACTEPCIHKWLPDYNLSKVRWWVTSKTSRLRWCRWVRKLRRIALLTLIGLFEAVQSCGAARRQAESHGKLGLPGLSRLQLRSGRQTCKAAVSLFGPTCSQSPTRPAAKYSQSWPIIQTRPTDCSTWLTAPASSSTDPILPT